VITACKAVPVRAAGRPHEGHQRRLGKKMLADSGLPIIAADTMAEAARRSSPRGK
jgi:succinyl-CoA synthetase beta subunit